MSVRSSWRTRSGVLLRKTIWAPLRWDLSRLGSESAQPRLCWRTLWRRPAAGRQPVLHHPARRAGCWQAGQAVGRPAREGPALQVRRQGAGAGVLKPGEFFGDLILGGQLRSANVQAVTRAMLRRVSRATMERVLAVRAAEDQQLVVVSQRTS